MKRTFHERGPRTFMRVEDQHGDLVAYVGGKSMAEMQLRAILIAEALQAHEDRMEEQAIPRKAGTTSA